MEGRRSWEGGLGSDVSRGGCLTAPLDSGLRRNDDGGGPALLGRWVGLRCIEEGLPRPSPPLWIPAFAGMTNWGAGMARRGGGDDGGGGGEGLFGIGVRYKNTLPFLGVRCSISSGCRVKAEGFSAFTWVVGLGPSSP